MLDTLANPNILYNAIRKFVKFVDFMNGNEGKQTVHFMQGWLKSEEGYKRDIWKLANDILDWDKWDQSEIGTGRIAEKMLVAIDLKGNNFVDWRNKSKFKKILNDTSKRNNAEQVLFDIYKKDDNEKAFAKALKIFGGNYDLISFLFFVKDCEHFLPVKPEDFERAFANIGIEYKMVQKASWENYNGYLKNIELVEVQLRDCTDPDHILSVLDAHSFVWIVGQKRFVEWSGNIPVPTAEPKSVKEFCLRPTEYIPVLKGNPITENHYIREQKRNKLIGDAGEEFVLRHERKKVLEYGIDLVPERKSLTEGDGLGYDILSYDENGNEIFIEVKTTTGKEDARFYITANELKKSDEVGDAYRLYRVYEFDKVEETGKISRRSGSLASLCINPLNYLVCFDFRQPPEGF
jgi:hypothetical protein